jgi:hypothetical protein
MQENSNKLKFCVNVFGNIFQCCYKVSKTPRLQCKRLGDTTRNNIIYFDDFCVVMRLQMMEKFNKQIKQV